MQYKRLRGFHDLYGREAGLFTSLEAKAREVLERFGFEEIRIPLLEEKALFARALGPDTDVVQKEMYEFKDRSKTDVALRPEGTAGVVRAYLENNLHKTRGLVKFYYLGPMFRSERPQAGRLRQFHQIGAEILGTESPFADAEIIQSLALFLDEARSGTYRLRLNNLGSFEERDGYRQVLLKYFKPVKAKLCEDCQARLSKNVLRILDCKKDACVSLARKAPPLSGHLGTKSREHFDGVLRSLAAHGTRYEIDEYLVRGLDYYTGTVFEVNHPRLGAQDALAAGGRYDGLVESFGGPRAGAVGFALGTERLRACLTGEEAAGSPSFFIVALGQAAFEEGLKVLSILRKVGLKTLMDFDSRSLKSQMRLADRYGCSHVIILGDNEISRRRFILKDYKTGRQEEFPLEDVAPVCRSWASGGVRPC